MWLLLPHSMSINRGKEQGHQMHSAYNIALFQQSLHSFIHSFIHPTTNKSLDQKKQRWRQLRVMERELERHLFVDAPPSAWFDDWRNCWWADSFHCCGVSLFFRLHSVLLEVKLRTGGGGGSQYGENRICPWEVRMGPGAGLKMAWLRGGPCRRWWCAWWAVAAARSASGLEEAAAAIAAAMARGLGRRPAPNALVKSYTKRNIMTQWYHIVIWHTVNCMQAHLNFN